jgi:fatty-acyl-CoA synthase
MVNLGSVWNWVGDWAGKRAMLTPNRRAIFDSTTNKSYTFDEMNNRANQLARVLKQNGIEQGDRVGTYAKNRVEMFDLFLATGKIGAILVPFNWRLATREIEYLAKKTSPKIMIYDANIVEGFEAIREHYSGSEVFVMGDSPLDDPSITELMRDKSSNDIERPALDLEDTHLIVFTGGTTGLPKGAMLPHRLTFWNSVNTIVSWGLRPDDIQPLLFPLFHTGGWNVLSIPFYHIGAETVLMGDFNPEETLRIIEERKCTIVIGVPTMFQMMAQSDMFHKTDISSVRVFISGGAPCPVAIMENYWNRGKPFKMGYGLTEVGPNNFYLPESEIKKKPTTVGFPVFHADMKIVDDDGNALPDDEVGELLLRGPHAFSGYWDDPEETAETVEEDGWVHTGDLAVRDDEGFYAIVGRKKDMFISGGENVFPTEIEELLYKHPAVLEAAVIGVPDEKWGEVGKAFVTVKKSKKLEPEDLREYLKDKLAKYKMPKYYEIRDSLPMSGAGKILKRELEKEEQE